MQRAGDLRSEDDAQDHFRQDQTGRGKKKYLAGQLVPAFDYSARFSKALFDPLVLRVLSRVGRGNESDLLRDYFAVFLSQKYGYDCDLMFAL